MLPYLQNRKLRPFQIPEAIFDGANDELQEDPCSHRVLIEPNQEEPLLSSLADPNPASSMANHPIDLEEI